METLFIILNFLLIGLLIAFPIVFLAFLKKHTTGIKLFLSYISVSLIISGLLIILTVWWFNTSDEILLLHYGYNFDGMSNMERYGNVEQVNMGDVKRIETSLMGIGWPLKAMFGYVMFVLYLFVVFLIDKIQAQTNR